MVRLQGHLPCSYSTPRVTYSRVFFTTQQAPFWRRKPYTTQRCLYLLRHKAKCRVLILARTNLHNTPQFLHNTPQLEHTTPRLLHNTPHHNFFTTLHLHNIFTTSRLHDFFTSSHLHDFFTSSQLHDIFTLLHLPTTSYSLINSLLTKIILIYLLHILT